MRPETGSTASRPPFARPYLRLARLDRPIGSWLLLMPCWWSVGLAGMRTEQFPSLWHIVLFFIGAFAMRGAGCTWNDLVDRDLDGTVERTRSRPIPSGQVTVAQATVFMLAQALVGLLVLLQFNRFTVITGLASLLVVAIYPFMKRITYWPQIVLGLAFSWGALMGWPAAFGRLDWPALVLYAGSISWVIGYDTIYAHQDREDDLLIGIKSTALLFGENTRPMLASFYAGAVVLIGVAGLMAGGELDLRARADRLRRASRLAGAAPRHQRPRALPEAVQIEPRRRADPVRRHAAGGGVLAATLRRGTSGGVALYRSGARQRNGRGRDGPQTHPHFRRRHRRTDASPSELKRHGFEPLVIERENGLRAEGYMMDFFGTGWDVASRMGLDRARCARCAIRSIRWNSSTPPASPTSQHADRARCASALGGNYVYLRRPDLEGILARARARGRRRSPLRHLARRARRPR